MNNNLSTEVKEQPTIYRPEPVELPSWLSTPKPSTPSIRSSESLSLLAKTESTSSEATSTSESSDGDGGFPWGLVFILASFFLLGGLGWGALLIIVPFWMYVLTVGRRA